MDTIRDNIKCEGCAEPTKHPVGFWDGRTDGGIMFDCESVTCPIAQERRRLAEEAAERVRQAKAENAQHGIDIKALDDARRTQQITVREMADRLGISPALFCDYQRERKPIPPDIAEVWREANAERGGKYNPAMKEALQNASLLHSCDVHDFNIADIRRAVMRSSPLNWTRAKCKCRKCGGEIFAVYAGGYMDALKAIEKQRSKDNE